jgi:hypothetical protein
MRLRLYCAVVRCASRAASSSEGSVDPERRRQEKGKTARTMRDQRLGGGPSRTQRSQPCHSALRRVTLPPVVVNSKMSVRSVSPDSRLVTQGISCPVPSGGGIGVK